MSQHPSYANPTIREALCEIHFILPESVAWDQAYFGKFYKHIQKIFPEMEPVAESAMRLQLQPGRVEFMPGQSRMRYHHASRNIMLQLASGVLTVNVLPKYEGWNKMEKDIYQAWTWAEEVIRPQGISRVGLRYINFVPKTEPSERPIDWFTPNKYIARAALDSLPGVLARAEIQTETDHRSIVTFGESPKEDPRNFLLDIDCVAENLDSPLSLGKIIDSLHDNVWAIFKSFLSPRLETFLEGGA